MKLYLLGLATVLLASVAAMGLVAAGMVAPAAVVIGAITMIARTYIVNTSWGMSALHPGPQRHSANWAFVRSNRSSATKPLSDLLAA
jgi:uncharacterized membrane protein YphA (DoxX/SURF4 family)